jgi:hypothetical protein
MKVEALPDDTIVIVQKRAHSTRCSLDKIDQHLTNTAIRKKAEELMMRSFGAAAACQALRGLDIDPEAKQLEAAGGKYIHPKLFSNWFRAHKTGAPDLRTHGHLAPWEEQVGDADGLLEEKQWHHDYFCIDRETKKKNAPKESHGIVFAMDNRLRKLRQYGRLVIIDTTHKTNYLGWYLYTIVVRDCHEMYWPAAHILKRTVKMPTYFVKVCAR